jgi:hypothetical protein
MVQQRAVVEAVRGNLNYFGRQDIAGLLLMSATRHHPGLFEPGIADKMQARLVIIPF